MQRIHIYQQEHVAAIHISKTTQTHNLALHISYLIPSHHHPTNRIPLSSPPVLFPIYYLPNSSSPSNPSPTSPPSFRPSPSQTQTSQKYKNVSSLLNSGALGLATLPSSPFTPVALPTTALGIVLSCIGALSTLLGFTTPAAVLGLEEAREEETEICPLWIGAAAGWACTWPVWTGAGGWAMLIGDVDVGLGGALVLGAA